MVSLVIISNSPKTEYIKQYLHAAIKVTIDVVADIDQALQDIFVKRPTVVCIQNRISGINAEEIARHIQMLLRNGAPAFILMHESDGGARQVTGLFEHLLDLTLPEPKLAEALAAALQSILGPQWEQICRPLHAQQDHPREPAGAAPAPPRESAAPADDPFVLVTSLDEFMNTMPGARDSGQESDVPVASAVPVREAPSPPPRTKAASSRRLAVPETAANLAAGHAPLAPDMPAALSAAGGPPTPAPPPAAVRPPHPPSVPKTARSGNRPAHTALAPSAASTPGDFRIATPAMADEESRNDIAPFIEGFELPGRRRKRWAGIALAVMACVVAGAWYLLRPNPGVLAVVRPPSPPASAGQPKPAPGPAGAQTAISSARPSPAGPAAAPLPAFVPAHGRDSRYAARHPGWERYAGPHYECRIFREKDRIKAVQVLAVKAPRLDEALLKTVLTELAGSGTYRVTSRERVAGYEVERGQADGGADLLLYRRGAKLNAIVVSLN
ncbi:hypothetical protein FO488_07580 [Geobacter sp. FeAm09]|uniref:hypothetical protein n=1 Tax=Geobacter sp. FeAm09 TaxID=2597769 RepID=UPI0011EFF0FA|nr:hypothetical protein [Geobacter sp. FeAm09]QEM68032.1 hypothetical protein FO488_07580 [Geobacter sp. FeAm09]